MLNYILLNCVVLNYDTLVNSCSIKLLTMHFLRYFTAFTVNVYNLRRYMYAYVPIFTFVAAKIACQKLSVIYGKFGMHF